MNILSLLDTVNIQTIDKFPPEDMEYCKNEERIYNGIYNIHSEVAFLLKDANKQLWQYPDCTYERSLEDNNDNVWSCNYRFIDAICSYFRKKYSVTIDEPSWKTTVKERHNNEDVRRYDIVPLQYILDSIYDQMGGMTFLEKAFAELQEGAREAMTSHSGKSKYCIRCVKLIIEGFYSSHKRYMNNRYEATVETKHRSFFTALTHFEYGRFDISHKYSFLTGYSIYENEGIYDKHTIPSSIIKSIKVYKNGKLDVEFKDYITAVKFVETYFPGLPQQAA